MGRLTASLPLSSHQTCTVDSFAAHAQTSRLPSVMSSQDQTRSFTIHQRNSLPATPFSLKDVRSLLYQQLVKPLNATLSLRDSSKVYRASVSASSPSISAQDHASHVNHTRLARPSTACQPTSPPLVDCVRKLKSDL